MGINEPSAPGDCVPSPDVDALREKLAECVAALERSGQREAETRSFAGDVSMDHARWVRLFNRLDAAVSRHRKAKQEGAFCDDVDDDLHAAHDRILKSAATSEPKHAQRRVSGGG